MNGFTHIFLCTVLFVLDFEGNSALCILAESIVLTRLFKKKKSTFFKGQYSPKRHPVDARKGSGLGSFPSFGYSTLGFLDGYTEHSASTRPVAYQ